MKALYLVLVAGVVIGIRLWMFKARRRRQAGGGAAGPATGATGGEPSVLADRSAGGTRRARGGDKTLGATQMVARREIRERLRGRIFRVGTIVVLLAVAAAIVIPSLQKGGGSTQQTVGVVGGISPQTARLVKAYGTSSGDSVSFVHVASTAAANADLRSGKIAFAIVDSSEIVLNEPATASNSPADPTLVQNVATYLGVLRAYEMAHLTPAQATAVDSSKPVPVHTLRSGSKGAAKASSVIGIVLLFLMLTQYNTWILIGVMQEKSSRVVEVLLATLRPLQLLGGKVLGIGIVALGQATLIVGFALALSDAVGSDVLRGTGVLTTLSELLWLVLGYAFYCWVYAAAGSTAERQDQVQTLALPLSIPILIGYVFSITVASSGNPDLFFKVLAYLPPTAPFCMSVLVALGQVQWWQFTAAVLISIAGTAATALVAARIYRRAVLQTGGRVHIRNLMRTAG